MSTPITSGIGYLASGVGQITGLTHLSRVPKNLYNSEFKAAAKNLTEGVIRGGLLGVSAIVLASIHKNPPDTVKNPYKQAKDFFAPESDCEDIPNHQSRYSETSSHDTQTCSTAGRIAVFCKNLGILPLDELHTSSSLSPESVFGRERCIKDVVENLDSKSINFVKQHAQKLGKEVKNYCEFTHIKRETDYTSGKVNIGRYSKCIQDTIKNIDKLQSFM